MQTCFVFSCLLIALPTWAQTVFKCTDAKGAITLQQTPCAGAGQRLEVRSSAAPAPSPLPQQASPDARSAAEADRRGAGVSAGLAGGYPAVGMNMNQLLQVLGQPTRINTSDRGRGIEEQRIYERGTRTFYVYTENGMVRSIQTSASRPPTLARACPTDLDIRNMETTASSAGLTDSQREHYQRQIRDMRACR